MKHALFLLLLPVCSIAQVKIKDIKQVNYGLYLMYYDTTAIKHSITKSAVIEFKNYIALIEMPISDDGAGATNLKDHATEGKIVLETLKNKFPGKPLKYVLSTHWHPHSLSSGLPFLANGTTIVTTQKSYERLHEFIDDDTYKQYSKQIVFVKDSLIIKDKGNSIVAYRVDRKEYPYISAEDFVYYYLPKYNYLHSSCMYQRLGSAKVKGKEMVSTRVEDLYKFTQRHNIEPDHLITTATYWDEPNGMASGDTFKMINKNGIGMTALQNELLAMDNQVIQHTDSVIKMLMEQGMPYSILNQAVYTLLRNNELPKALTFARIQALMNPSDPNVWDTYGEVYYFLGEKKLAKKYELQSKRMNDKFTQGGEATWKADYDAFSKAWTNNK